MEEFIVKEAQLFLDSLYLGLVIMALYDILRLFRAVVRHKNIFVGIEDFLFWNMAGIFIFSLIYAENDGRIRWFIIAGICIGALVYAKSFGSFMVKYTSKFINRILNIVLKKPLRQVKMSIGHILKIHKRDGEERDTQQVRKVVDTNGKELWKKKKDT